MCWTGGHEGTGKPVDGERVPADERERSNEIRRPCFEPMSPTRIYTPPKGSQSLRCDKDWVMCVMRPRNTTQARTGPNTPAWIRCKKWEEPTSD